jgi:transposase
MTQATTVFLCTSKPAHRSYMTCIATSAQKDNGWRGYLKRQSLKCRIDWKDVLRLELTDLGFDASVLSEFRTHLVTGAAESLLLDTLLT